MANTLDAGKFPLGSTHERNAMREAPSESTSERAAAIAHAGKDVVASPPALFRLRRTHDAPADLRLL